MATTLNNVAETALDFSRDVLDSMGHFGRTAGKKIETARGQTGDALHAAASSMRRNSSKIDGLAKGAAKKLDATAHFVQHADLKGLRTGARRFSHNHLTLSLLVAAAAGFLAGAALCRGSRA
jgi:ElaB/YqjD/DUF883 family membrane-anchored ribosome-binding protein